ncbi:amidase [Rheinheimera maricola]|uniref:Amidase n=1 Tax=Rheinheimera maricola TaxID=2793282 RepID=A0ABS7XA20_9GAMM|nr:amidase [Rheinheimera maricola]MBZ9612382.1 amidase [Rheinheimera maricola]
MRTLLTTISLLLSSSTAIAQQSPAWLDAQTAVAALQRGELTSEQLVNYYLARIAADNQQGYQLAAIADINKDAVAQAKALDQQRAAGKVLSPLHGLPVVLKANIATADAMPTTAGALALKGHVTARDAQLVQQLRAAGAVVLGKTNLSEWANFRGEGSASGWSALGGQVKNPHLLTHTPCGSSSGSAAAVAADFSLLAVGTETDGSITCPAAINGVVGIKPSRGAVSGEGIIPIASAQDIAGPMARKVFDAALLLDAMLTPEAKSKLSQPLAQAAVATSKAKKVLLVRAYDKRNAALSPMFNQLAVMLQASGVEVVNNDSWTLPGELYQAEFQVLIYEFKRDLEQWLKDYQVNENLDTLAEIVAFNQQQGEAALAFYGQQYLQQAAEIDLQKDQAAYQQALQQSRLLAERALNQYLKQQQFDAIILPSYGPAWLIDHVNGDSFNFGTSTAAAVAGYPSVTLPATYSGVLPLGISVVGLPWSEAELVALAATLERFLGAYRQPQFLTAAE